MRKLIIAGNWKMNYSAMQGANFLENILDDINTDKVDVVICPNLTALSEINALLEDYESNVKLGAQNIFYEDKGAYTGETSGDMLLDVGVSYVIIGHSERRQYFLESDEIVNKKIKKSFEVGLIPIMCCGETLDQRESNETFNHIKNQIVNGLKDISEDDIENLIIAYEPIWAIGTGKTATAIQAEEVCKFIREEVKELYNEKVSNNIRIIYGGSIKPVNAKEIFMMDNIDGGLIGGASLKPDFIEIVNWDK